MLMKVQTILSLLLAIAFAGKNAAVSDNEEVNPMMSPLLSGKFSHKSIQSSRTSSESPKQIAESIMKPNLLKLNLEDFQLVYALEKYNKKVEPVLKSAVESIGNCL